MKKYIVIAILFVGFHTSAQRAPAYKYTYTFSPPGSPIKPYIIIDSSNNLSGLTAISGEVKDDTGAAVMFPVILLQQENKKARSFLNAYGKIDTVVISPGNYHISVNAAGYKSFDTSFSVRDKTGIHFKVVLTSSPSLTVYDISSKIKLTPAQIDEIKACVFKRDDWWKCSKKGVYRIMMEI